MADLDQAAAAKLVAALDAELAKRQSKRDAVEDQQWAEQFGGDAIIIIAKRLARDWGRRKPQVFRTPEDRECAVEANLEHSKTLYALANVVERLDRHREAEASGMPRMRPIIITPRIRVAPPPGNAKPVVDVLAKSGDANGKTPRKSRTAIWEEQQAAERAARQALVPQRPAALQPIEIGWHRGSILQFDQIGRIGTVKFAGTAGFTEAVLLHGAARDSGHPNFFPGERVDCKLLRRLDGSVVIEAIRLASGPEGSAAEQAAAAVERYKIQLGR